MNGDTVQIRDLPAAKILLWSPKVRGVACGVVEEFGKELEELVDYMTGTMYEHNGVGLAAPQIAVFKRVAVIQLVEDRSRPPFVMVNPAILNTAGKVSGSEGCLSLPGGYAGQRVPRALTVKVSFQDITGRTQEMEVSGPMARAIQHEVDHLHGNFFIDHLSSLKREMVIRKYYEAVRRTNLTDLYKKYRKDFTGFDSKLEPNVELTVSRPAGPHIATRITKEEEAAVAASIAREMGTADSPGS